jgi:hypothetical protein
MGQMNRLSNSDRCRVLACLVEGNSIRATLSAVSAALEEKVTTATLRGVALRCAPLF